MLDAIDAARLGWLLLAVADLSRRNDVRLRWSDERAEWQVTTRVERHPVRCDCGSCPKTRTYLSRGESPLAALEWARTELAVINRGVDGYKRRTTQYERGATR